MNSGSSVVISSGNEKEVCKQIADFDNVLVASVVYGEYDIIAKVDVEHANYQRPTYPLL